jgi:hypothetical protein
MKTSSGYVAAVVWSLLLAVLLPVGPGFANVATGVREQEAREVVHCFFGALRKDGQVMVNMVPGGGGALYHLSPGAPVTLNGSSVGPKYLLNGMPIDLILNRQKIVDEIRVRPLGGN